MIALYLFICLILSSFFSGMETGMLGADRTLLEGKKRRGVLYARAAEYLLAKQDRLLGATLIGNNIANVSAAVMFTNFMERIGLERITSLGILLMTFIFMVFADIIPKSFFRQQADTVTVRLAPLLLCIYLLLLPVYLVLNAVALLLLFVLGQHVSRREELKSKRDIRFLVGMAGKELGLPEDDQKVIEDIFDFRDQSAREVMVPFHELPVINVQQTLQDVVQTAYQTGSRFIGVSELRTDNLIGYVDTRELLWKDGSSTREVMREALFYPETVRISDLLLTMNHKSLEVVFLSDEYGGVAGMVTPHHIVGDLLHYSPETGYEHEAITSLESGHYLVAGDTDLEDLCHGIGITLKKGHNDTVGGFLCERLGVIPEVGATHEEGEAIFTVTRRNSRHVEEVDVLRKRT